LSAKLAWKAVGILIRAFRFFFGTIASESSWLPSSSSSMESSSVKSTGFTGDGEVIGGVELVLLMIGLPPMIGVESGWFFFLKSGAITFDSRGSLCLSLLTVVTWFTVSLQSYDFRLVPVSQ